MPEVSDEQLFGLGQVAVMACQHALGRIPAQDAALVEALRRVAAFEDALYEEDLAFLQFPLDRVMVYLETLRYDRDRTVAKVGADFPQLNDELRWLDPTRAALEQFEAAVRVWWACLNGEEEDAEPA